ncbi:MAG: nitroreductase family protein [Planctomycetota bacterium]
MNTLEAIEARRAVKHYDPDFEMPAADVTKLFDLALLSPTSFNIQNWRFVVCQDPEVKKRLRAVSWDQAQVEEAQLTSCTHFSSHDCTKRPLVLSDARVIPSAYL